MLDFETCNDYYNANNQSESGYYLVYLNEKPYEIYCDFTNGLYFYQCNDYDITLLTIFEFSFTGKGITRFDHDKMDEEIITNCETEDCYNLKMEYKESLELVDLIKERSSDCEQKLEVS